MKNFTLIFLLSCSLFTFTPTHARGPVSVYTIVLKTFRVSAAGNAASIVWDVETLIYDIDFQLQRSSDGVHFETIEMFSLTEGFSGITSYVDKNLKTGTYYYRLYVDKTGFLPYKSDVISVKVAKSGNNSKSYTIINPFMSQIVINGDFSNTSKVRVELTDMSGCVRLVKEVNPSAPGTINIPAGTVGAGIYILRIKEMDKNESSSSTAMAVYKRGE